MLSPRIVVIIPAFIEAEQKINVKEKKVVVIL
jgi:hypothetical protein